LQSQESFRTKKLLTSLQPSGVAPHTSRHFSPPRVLPISRQVRALDSTKSAMANPATRTLLVWGGGKIPQRAVEDDLLSTSKVNILTRPATFAAPGAMLLKNASR